MSLDMLHGEDIYNGNPTSNLTFSWSAWGTSGRNLQITVKLPSCPWFMPYSLASINDPMKSWMMSKWLRPPSLSIKTARLKIVSNCRKVQFTLLHCGLTWCWNGTSWLQFVKLFLVLVWWNLYFIFSSSQDCSTSKIVWLTKLLLRRKIQLRRNSAQKVLQK